MKMTPTYPGGFYTLVQVKPVHSKCLIQVSHFCGDMGNKEELEKEKRRGKSVKPHDSCLTTESPPYSFSCQPFTIGDIVIYSLCKPVLVFFF